MTAAAREEWRLRIVAEYEVCWLAQDIALRLTNLGAPGELIGDMLQLAIDELEHARLARAVCAALGDTEPAVFDPSACRVEHAEPAAADIAAAVVPSLCLGEVLAIRVNARHRRHAATAEARAAFDRIMHDEPKHAALGWLVLDWLLTHEDGPAVRRVVDERLDEWQHALLAGYHADGARPSLRDLDDADRAWGIAPPLECERAALATAAHDWPARLARRGFSEVGVTNSAVFPHH